MNSDIFLQKDNNVIPIKNIAQDKAFFFSAKNNWFFFFFLFLHDNICCG